jgi:LPS O-antigen subunit length determinant protein (WzzB/FepE family)
MPADSQPVEGGLDIVALWNLLWSSRLLIIICGLVGAAIAATLALMATPLFRAEITVTEVSNPGMGAVSSLSRQFGGIAALAGINLSGAAGESADARAVLKSRRLCEEFISRPGVLKQLYPPGSKQPTLWMAVKRFRESYLSINEDQRTGTITLALMAESPADAARWANDYVGLANEILRARALCWPTRARNTRSRWSIRRSLPRSVPVPGAPS